MEGYLYGIAQRPTCSRAEVSNRGYGYIQDLSSIDPPSLASEEIHSILPLGTCPKPTFTILTGYKSNVCGEQLIGRPDMGLELCWRVGTHRYWILGHVTWAYHNWGSTPTDGGRSVAEWAKALLPEHLRSPGFIPLRPAFGIGTGHRPYVWKFVSYLVGFLRVLRFPPPMNRLHFTALIWPWLLLRR